jgi:hypothetical protein
VDYLIDYFIKKALYRSKGLNPAIGGQVSRTVKPYKIKYQSANSKIEEVHDLVLSV